MTHPKNDNFIKHGIYHSEDLIKHYYRKTNGHFFDKSTMRFFNARVSDTVYPGSDIVFFITSEKYDHNSPRLFTLRSYRPNNGEIETIGEFQQFKAKASAARYAINLLINEDKQ